jgi:acetyltransferase-like isoleucine patch superfamily enzyme
MFRHILKRLLDPLVQRLAKRSDYLRLVDIDQSARLSATIAPSAIIHETAEIANLLKNKIAITVGANTHIRGQLLVFWNGGTIQIGAWSFIGEGSRIWSQSSISIGNHVLISHGVDIHDTDGHPIHWHERRMDSKAIFSGSYLLPTTTVSAPIVIEDDVWIGLKSTVLKGVRLGRGAIVAAASVVTKDVEPWTIVAGNPAKEVCRLDDRGSSM